MFIKYKRRLKYIGKLLKIEGGVILDHKNIYCYYK